MLQNVLLLLQQLSLHDWLSIYVLGGYKNTFFRGKNRKKLKPFLIKQNWQEQLDFMLCMCCALLPHLPFVKNISKFYPKHCFTSQKYIDLHMLLKIIGDSLWINKFKLLIDWSNWRGVFGYSIKSRKVFAKQWLGEYFNILFCAEYCFFKPNSKRACKS